MKTKKAIGLLLFVIGFTYSCDYVRQPYTVEGPNGCTSPEPTFIPRTNPKRKVLIEDFTGHRCGVCPNAHIALNSLQVTYGEQVIGVALHAEKEGDLTKPENPNPENKFLYDFRTLAANEVDLYFGINSFGIPNGLINRKFFGSQRAVGHTVWSDKVSDLLAIPPQMDIQLKNYYDPAAQSICSYAYMEALENLNSNYKLVLWLTESNIVNWQKFYGNTPVEIPDYIHNHVLRAPITNVWGVSVANGGVMKMGESFVDGYSISTNNTDWNINNLHVVAFVYDAVTYEIIQAEEVKVIP